MAMPDKEPTKVTVSSPGGADAATKEQTHPESPQPTPPVEIPSPEAADKRRKERLAVESALLDRDDYTYQVFYSRDGNREEKPISCPTLSQAKKMARKVNGRIEQRIKKSGCRKFADFYRLCLPKDPVPRSVDLVQLGNFIFQTERGSGWSAVKVMREDEKQDLVLVKAEYSISVVTPDGRSYAGVGACAVSDGRGFMQPSHDIPATAYTRALNRAITEAVGWGAGPADEADEQDHQPPPVAPEPKKEAGVAERKAPAPAPAQEPEAKKPPASRRKPETKSGEAAADPKAADSKKPETTAPAPTQLNTIKVLAKQIGLADGQVDEEARSKFGGKDVAQLSQKDAFSFIHHLVSIKNRQAKSA